VDIFPCCPLCGGEQIQDFHQDQRRHYLRCETCALVFVPSRFHLDSVREKAEYDLHRNEVSDLGYRQFLTRLAHPLLSRMPDGCRGLEFGCGPGPALAAMLEEAGHTVSLYDPFYFPDRSVLQDDYDFVTATEVVEHLHRPGEELEMLWSQLRIGGWLGIMTKLVIDAQAFSRWHYKNDLTHVCFFSRATWKWWAESNTAELDIIGDDVILLRRPG
jgi:hypothetical protein